MTIKPMSYYLYTTHRTGGKTNIITFLHKVHFNYIHFEELLQNANVCLDFWIKMPMFALTFG